MGGLAQMAQAQDQSGGQTSFPITPTGPTEAGGWGSPTLAMNPYLSPYTGLFKTEGAEAKPLFSMPSQRPRQQAWMNRQTQAALASPNSGMVPMPFVSTAKPGVSPPVTAPGPTGGGPSGLGPANATTFWNSQTNQIEPLPPEGMPPYGAPVDSQGRPFVPQVGGGEPYYIPNYVPAKKGA